MPAANAEILKKDNMKYFFLPLLCIGLIKSAHAEPYAEVRKNIAYNNADPENVIDLYYPQTGEGPYPTHIMIHGGGWVKGTKELGGLEGELFLKLSEQGFLGVSVEYRKVDKARNQYMRTSTVDALDAVRYVVAHAEELNVDPKQIFVWGGSAGGHLALMAATAIDNPELSDIPELASVSVKIRGALAWFPPCDMENYEAISVEKNGKLRLLSDRMGCTLEDNRAAYQEISPLYNLSSDCPPILIFHGDADNVVNMEHSIRFKKKTDQQGVDCTLQIVHNAGHGFSRQPEQSPSADDIINASSDFFSGLAAQK